MYISPHFLFSRIQTFLAEFSYDGAADLHAGLRGLGAMLRNEEGELLFAVSKGMSGHFSVKAAELYAAAMGLQARNSSGWLSFGKNHAGIGCPD